MPCGGWLRFCRPCRRLQRLYRPACVCPAASAIAGVPGADRVLARTKLQEDLAADMQRHHRFQENTLPLIFLGAGALLLLLNALVLIPKLGGVMGQSSGIADAIVGLIYCTVVFVVQLPCLFVGILIVSKIFGSAFGELLTALKKLAAMALLAGQFHLALGLALDILLDGFGFIGVSVKFAASFLMFWILAQKLFDELEMSESLVLWLAMIFLPGFAAIGIIILVMAMF